MPYKPQLPPPVSQPVTQPAELRERLLLAIGDWLGRFKDGSPAIWVGKPPKRLGPVSGALAVVEPVPRLWGAPIGIGDQVLLDQTWEVLITNFDDGGQHLGAMVQRLLSLPGVRGGIYLMATDDTYEQYRLSLACPGFIELWQPPPPPYTAPWVSIDPNNDNTWITLGGSDPTTRLLLGA